MIKAFQRCDLPATLEICGYGKAGDDVAKLISGSPRLLYHGLKTPNQCLRFGRTCDVLVNPRPATHGNENNFASKLFDYALCGRSIMTTWLSGVQEVLGPEAFYLDAYRLEEDLPRELARVCGISRTELNRRGDAIQTRILSDFCWEAQAERLAAFIGKICGVRISAVVEREAQSQSLAAAR